MEAAASGGDCGAQSQGTPGPSQTPAEPFAEPPEGTSEAPLPPTQVDDPAEGSWEPPGLSGGAAGAGAVGRAAADGPTGGDADGCAEQAAAAAEALAALLAQKVWTCAADLYDAFDTFLFAAVLGARRKKQRRCRQA